jgi:hypothetical protein
MPPVSFASMETAPIVPSPALASGRVVTRGLFARDRDPLQLLIHHLDPDAQLIFSGMPSERAIFVWQGEIMADGARLAARSSLIVEYGATLTVTSGQKGAALLEFGAQHRSALDRIGGHVHLMPSEQVQRPDTSNRGKRVGMSLHANAQCPTCRVWLHENQHWESDSDTALHSHSEDEVMFITAGSMRVGNRFYPAGNALAVRANTKYGFTSGPDGLSFVNFRIGSPTYTTADGSMTLDEAELWRKACGEPNYLTRAARIDS